MITSFLKLVFILIGKTWQNCGHRAVADVAIVAKTRTTKALIISPEKTLEMVSLEVTLEIRTTTLVILAQLKQHGDPIFGCWIKSNCPHHFCAWFNWSPNIASVQFDTICALRRCCSEVFLEVP